MLQQRILAANIIDVVSPIKLLVGERVRMQNMESNITESIIKEEAETTKNMEEQMGRKYH